jgi:thioredoxin reductase (NADPH)
MIENVIIIGGGPAGLAASIYLARANLNPLVLAGSPPGGQLILTSEVENYPGFESILGPELINKYRQHALKFGVRILDENVIKVAFSNESNKSHRTHRIHASNGTHESKSVIITTGAKALWLNLPSETRLRGKGVSACATCDGFFFRDKIVAVIGGGDTAMEEALTLTKFAKKVLVIHRKAEFRASKIMQNRVLNHPKIEIIWNSTVDEILGEIKVNGVKIRNSKLEIQNLDVDGVFISIGHKPDTDLFKGQIDLDEKGYILTTDRLAHDYLLGKREISPEKLVDFRKGTHYSYSTSVPGIFAAGDCVDHIYKQAATAVGMGVAAALEIEKYLAFNN